MHALFLLPQNLDKDGEVGRAGGLLVTKWRVGLQSFQQWSRLPSSCQDACEWQVTHNYSAVCSTHPPRWE